MHPGERDSRGCSHHINVQHPRDLLSEKVTKCVTLIFFSGPPRTKTTPPHGCLSHACKNLLPLTDGDILPESNLASGGGLYCVCLDLENSLINYPVSFVSTHTGEGIGMACHFTSNPPEFRVQSSRHVRARTVGIACSSLSTIHVEQVCFSMLSTVSSCFVHVLALLSAVLRIR